MSNDKISSRVLIIFSAVSFSSARCDYCACYFTFFLLFYYFILTPNDFTCVEERIEIHNSLTINSKQSLLCLFINASRIEYESRKLFFLIFECLAEHSFSFPSLSL